ncbi:MAG: phage major capsid protein [Acidobacteriota bacterium]|nr:phage major capsid protein [Acidobacteriota bacterium]
MDPKELKQQFDEALKPLHEKLTQAAERFEKQEKTFGVASTEAKAAVDKALTEIGELRKDHAARMLAIEQKLTAPKGGDEPEIKSIGQLLVETDEFKSLASRGRGSATLKVPAAAWRKTAITNVTGQNQPVVPPDRISRIMAPMLQRLRVRDLLTALRTSSNLIEFSKENSFTNNAAPQGKGSSPQVYENVAKAESALTFVLAKEPVQTIAHWIPASKQILADAPQLQDYIDNRLRQGLKKVEEDQLLNGSGTGGDLNGLITQATAYDTGLDVVGDTKIDTLRRAILQAELAFYEISGFVLNPTDWADIELKKTTYGEYIFANPQGIAAPAMWGKPVVSTPSIEAGDFLTGDFTSNVVNIYDREDVSVTISTEHDDFFTRNMVAILCEERLALVVYAPRGLITGSYPASA